MGQGLTSIMNWVVLRPLSELRITIMCLLELLMGSIGGKVEINGEELLVNLINSDRIREVIERRVAEEMMWWMESEVDKK